MILKLIYVISHMLLFNNHKTFIMKKSIVFFAISFMLVVCGFMPDIKPQTFTKSFISEPDNEGYIVNSKPKTFFPYYGGGQGKEIQIGWDGQGFAMRGFISFDFSGIKPKPGEVLVIDRALLRVYEANTNMHPFNGDGTRTVQCYLVDYQNIDAEDFDVRPIDNCGTIAVNGYSVLTEHPLVVTSKVTALIAAHPATTKFQFRLQFTDDENLSSGSQLKQSMWNIFSGEESGKAAYRPALVLKYHYLKPASPKRLK